MPFDLTLLLVDKGFPSCWRRFLSQHRLRHAVTEIVHGIPRYPVCCMLLLFYIYFVLKEIQTEVYRSIIVVWWFGVQCSTLYSIPQPAVEHLLVVYVRAEVVPHVSPRPSARTTHAHTRQCFVSSCAVSFRLLFISYFSKVSNLNRQFLFREHNVGQAKSTAAAAAAKAMNTSVKVQ